MAKMKIASVSFEHDTSGASTSSTTFGTNTTLDRSIDMSNVNNIISDNYTFKGKYNFRSDDYWRSSAKSKHRHSKGDLFDKHNRFEGNLFEWDAKTGIVVHSEHANMPAGSIPFIGGEASASSSATSSPAISTTQTQKIFDTVKWKDEGIVEHRRVIKFNHKHNGQVPTPGRDRGGATKLPQIV